MWQGAAARSRDGVEQAEAEACWSADSELSFGGQGKITVDKEEDGDMRAAGSVATRLVHSSGTCLALALQRRLWHVGVVSGCEEVCEEAWARAA
jgi:hypothetical protein